MTGAQIIGIAMMAIFILGVLALPWIDDWRVGLWVDAFVVVITGFVVAAATLATGVWP